jgi:hypothetical protein
MYKEPISWLYKSRGRPARITKARQRWPKVYSIKTSDILRVKASRNVSPFLNAILPGEWQKN